MYSNRTHRRGTPEQSLNLSKLIWSEQHCVAFNLKTKNAPEFKKFDLCEADIQRHTHCTDTHTDVIFDQTVTPFIDASYPNHMRHNGGTILSKKIIEHTGIDGPLQCIAVPTGLTLALTAERVKPIAHRIPPCGNSLKLKNHLCKNYQYAGRRKPRDTHNSTVPKCVYPRTRPETCNNLSLNSHVETKSYPQAEFVGQAWWNASTRLPSVKRNI